MNKPKNCEHSALSIIDIIKQRHFSKVSMTVCTFPYNNWIGIIKLPVAKAGHDVTGLDFDEYMMERIAHKITNEKIKWNKALLFNLY